MEIRNKDQIPSVSGNNLCLEDGLEVMIRKKGRRLREMSTVSNLPISKSFPGIRESVGGNERGSDCITNVINNDYC